MADGVNIHSNHRQRIRNRFKREGLDHFEPHEILELLLYDTYKQGDTNPVSHNLIKEFGSLAGVFDAEFDDLVKVKGVGEQSAVLIKMMPALCRRYYTERYQEGYRFTGADDIGKFLQSLYIGVNEEVVYALFLDNSAKLLRPVNISRGTYSEVNPSIRKIAEHAMRLQATSVVLAHNHPKGLATPSPGDVAVTKEIHAALKKLNIRFDDHIVVGCDDYISMRLSPKFSYIFK